MADRCPGCGRRYDQEPVASKSRVGLCRLCVAESPMACIVCNDAGEKLVENGWVCLRPDCVAIGSHVTFTEEGL